MKYTRFLSLLLAALMALLPLSALAEDPVLDEERPAPNGTKVMVDDDPEAFVELTRNITVDPYIPDGMEKTIIGADNRITIDNPNVYPYSAIAYLCLWYECGHSASGSGFMVGRYGMVTAGHCVVCSQDGADLESMVAYFGYRSNKNYAYKFAGGYTYWWSSNYDYTANSLDWDYAYFLLDEPVGATVGSFGISARSDKNLDMTLVEIAGYRDGLLKTDFDYAHIYNNYVISYENDTVPGNSGCPVFDANYNVVAIHVAGDSFRQMNFGRRITSSLLESMQSNGLLN